MEVAARTISGEDAAPLERAFRGTRWERGLAFFEALVARHREREASVFVGLADGAPAGFAALVRPSPYPPFREQGIPEIRELAVAPRYRRRRIGSAILDRAERAAFEASERVGIGLGLHPGYRAAQRLYVLRGYVPDGRGLFRRGGFPEEGESVPLDDELLLHLVKERPEGRSAPAGFL